MASRSFTRIRAAVILAAGVLALSACAGTSSATPASDAATDAGNGELNVQLAWILNEEWSGEFIAEHEGYFADAGFSAVNLIPGPSSGIAELLSGTADVSLTDALSVGAAVANESAPLKVIGATFQKNPFTIASLTEGANITTPEQMVGKKIGVQDSNRAVFNAFLAANDIDQADVDIVPIQYDPAPLTTGEVDGMIAFVTSQSTTIELSGTPVTDLLFADNNLPFVGHVVTATDETIAAHRDALKDFLHAEILGWQDAVADPSEGATLAVDQYGADLGLTLEGSLASATAQAELLVTSAETAENGLFTISDDLQQQTIQSLAAAGYDLDVTDLFDLSLLTELYDENPDLLTAQS
ncbi:ABC transporter substrate-binding protein [Microbacterium sp. cx-55]|uniref:ABC transporter substrate-binding protein n=1 Tax=unclassified Microbacterium TaxID=2609290 RepID=UPI001CBEDC93|nr:MULTISPECIES: ABC transporter substrate-binding protein [unclassified Microbacterium]MBZ4487321.1 ABC transporter substrate-binding protein [Microbacterium sp. cx-55]MCC4908558.1 ABC transporter substrate-binding protein [Microbacterium sp. cx-59]UGB35343.1 ABC transporter substrate-binding protein [Microbacterium sp. cx-55]